MITVVTPFQRKENLELLANVIKGHANWIVLIDDHDLAPLFPEWVTVKKMDKPPVRANLSPSNWLFNEFISQGLEQETQYMILCDDDSVEEGFFEKIPDADVVITSMKRGDNVQVNPNYPSPIDLIAKPENMKIGWVGGEQCILKGKVLRNFRYGLNHVGDGVMVMRVVEEYTPLYLPDAYVLFNYFQDGRYNSFKRKKKPLVLFVGDYFCAANPKMGKSEWEGNIAASIDSSGLADVLTFHFDKYFYHYNKTGDEALIDCINKYNPDYIVMVYHLGGMPHPQFGNYSVPSFQTLFRIKGVPIIFIWGDLEDEQQRYLAKSLEPFAWKMIGTANKEVVESLGYKYMHVPKDSRIFNDPQTKRDIEVIFTGSVHQNYRPERYRILKYIIDSGEKIEVGGSEGGDHYSTEDYARGYQRAKMAISFSKAGGMNVVNARVFEIMSCGAMLLEQESKELEKLYTPYVDYVPWTDEVDLLKKIRYYSEHDKERLLIANNGCAKTHKLYSAKTFWSEVLK